MPSERYESTAASPASLNQALEDVPDTRWCQVDAQDGNLQVDPAIALGWVVGYRQNCTDLVARHL